MTSGNPLLLTELDDHDEEEDPMMMIVKIRGEYKAKKNSKLFGMDFREFYNCLAG